MANVRGFELRVPGSFPGVPANSSSQQMPTSVCSHCGTLDEPHIYPESCFVSFQELSLRLSLLADVFYIENIKPQTCSVGCANHTSVAECVTFQVQQLSNMIPAVRNKLLDTTGELDRIVAWRVKKLARELS